MKNCKTPNAIAFLDDYCGRCNPAGDQADSQTRLCSMVEPDAVTWSGGKRVTCEYVCDTCGHTWTRSDLWDARSAGFITAGAAA